MNRFRNAVLRRCKSLSRVGRPSPAPYSNLRSMSTRDAAAAVGVADADDDGAAASDGGGGGAVVFVGSSRRRYVISAEHLSHPLIAALIDEGRSKDQQPVAVVNCEVVLFDHLLWMLDNAVDDDHLRGGDGATMRELAQLALRLLIGYTSMHGSSLTMLSSKDVNFVGYTYKNFEIVNDPELPGIAELKKKNNKPKRPTIKSLFETADTEDQTSEGSFLNLLPTQLELPESLEPSPHSSVSPEDSQARHR